MPFVLLKHQRQTSPRAESRHKQKVAASRKKSPRAESRRVAERQPSPTSEKCKKFPFFRISLMRRFSRRSRRMPRDRGRIIGSRSDRDRRIEVGSRVRSTDRDRRIEIAGSSDCRIIGLRSSNRRIVGSKVGSKVGSSDCKTVQFVKTLHRQCVNSSRHC